MFSLTMRCSKCCSWIFKSSKESGGLGPVMERLKCQKKEENTGAGEEVKRNQTNEQLNFSVLPIPLSPWTSASLRTPAEGWLSQSTACNSEMALTEVTKLIPDLFLPLLSMAPVLCSSSLLLTPPNLKCITGHFSWP